MASKANANTTNTELVHDILDDQAAFMLSHLSHGTQRQNRIEHNLKELFIRLGEELPDNTPMYCL